MTENEKLEVAVLTLKILLGGADTLPADEYRKWVSEYVDDKAWWEYRKGEYGSSIEKWLAYRALKIMDAL